MATNEEILTPKVLIVPTYEPADSQTYAAKGTLAISGAKLFVATGTGTWEIITSTAN